MNAVAKITTLLLLSCTVRKERSGGRTQINEVTSAPNVEQRPLTWSSSVAIPADGCTKTRMHFVFAHNAFTL